MLAVRYIVCDFRPKITAAKAYFAEISEQKLFCMDNRIKMIYNKVKDIFQMKGCFEWNSII